MFSHHIISLKPFWLSYFQISSYQQSVFYLQISLSFQILSKILPFAWTLLSWPTVLTLGFPSPSPSLLISVTCPGSFWAPTSQCFLLFPASFRFSSELHLLNIFEAPIELEVNQCICPHFRAFANLIYSEIKSLFSMQSYYMSHFIYSAIILLFYIVMLWAI